MLEEQHANYKQKKNHDAKLTTKKNTINNRRTLEDKNKHLEMK